MKTISISQAKATLSEQIGHAQHGEEVIITDRGKPVAKLVAVKDAADSQGLRELERAGLVRVGSALKAPFLKLPRRADPSGELRRKLNEEREGGF
jgi:prevent-host-death family protein